MKLLKSEKGEFTVEATIVFTITFITLIFMIYVGMIMYQHVHLQSATDRIASRGAMMYATRTTDMETGYKSPESFWNSDPYRYIYDGGYKGTAKGLIQDSLNKALGVENVIASNSGDGATADIKLGIFTRKVIVSGKKTFTVPFISTFGVDNSIFNLNVESTAYIMDVPETIRNVDYACDMLLQIKVVSNVVDKVSGLKGKLQEFIDKISV